MSVKCHWCSALKRWLLALVLVDVLQAAAASLGVWHATSPWGWLTCVSAALLLLVLFLLVVVGAAQAQLGLLQPAA